MSDSWICFIEMTVSIIFTIFDYTWQWQHIGIKDIEQGGPKATNVEEKKMQTGTQCTQLLEGMHNAAPPLLEIACVRM